MGVIQRRNGGPLFIAEGDLVTERALNAGCEPVAVLCSEKGARRLAEFAPDYERYSFFATEELRRNVTGLGVPLEVISLFKRPEPCNADELLQRFRFGVFADNVDNPVNVGSIARNMAAMGWDALFLDNNSADPLARRALRVSMGNAFHVPHARVADTAEFIRAAAADGVTTIALTPASDAMPMRDVRLIGQRRLLVLGSERDGLSDDVLGACTLRVRIEMQDGIDSLNVAAASAVACYTLGK
ncbi:MAG: TrmH family RNA methyltransferase [Ilumatobacteraceae bacterium]|jgi:tRNA G18 (ribose-2'-O)-methylase SpoU